MQRLEFVVINGTSGRASSLFFALLFGTFGLGGCGGDPQASDATTGHASEGASGDASGGGRESSSTASGAGASDGGGGASGCRPGSVAPCYSGPPGSQDVGLCEAGSKTCSDSGVYGPCEGEVKPVEADECVVGGDANCDGTACVSSWATVFGDVGNQGATRVALDGLGNVYVIGIYYDSFDPDGPGGAPPFPPAPPSNPFGSVLVGTFLAKLDQTGALSWAKPLDAPLSGLALAVDSQNNAVVSGSFTQSAHVDGETLTVPGHGGYIARFDPLGDHEIVVVEPDHEFRNLGIDGDDNIVVFGDLHDGFPGDTKTNTFLMKFSAAGDPLWEHHFPETFEGDTWPSTLRVAPDGSIVIWGHFSAPIDFGAGPHAPVGDYTGNAFLVRFDEDGQATWSRAFSAPGTQVYPADVALDAAGDLYVIGTFAESIDLGGGLLETQGSTQLDVFVGKFSSTGAHAWSKRFGYTTGVHRGVSIAVDSMKRVAIAGWADSPMDFDGTVLPDVSNAAPTFLTRLTTAGVVLSAAQYVQWGSVGPNGIAFTPLDDVILAGGISGGADFGGGVIMSTPGASNVLVVKLDP
jgi:hypothetical protein